MKHNVTRGGWSLCVRQRLDRQRRTNLPRLSLAQLVERQTDEDGALPCRAAGKGWRIPSALFFALALTGCAHVQTRYAPTFCLTRAQFEQLKASQPPKVRSQLTGDAAKDVGILAGSAIRLRAHDDGLLEVLGGCVDAK